MGKQAWSIRLNDRNHRVEIDFGYWLGGVGVRVDGDVVLRRNALMDMAYDRGVDIPISIEGHSLVIAIRPTFEKWKNWATGYRFALTVDGEPAAGSAVLPTIVAGKHGIRSLNGFVEAVAWGAGVAGSGRLVVDGQAFGAVLVLGAPALCSLAIRQSAQLPSWIRALLGVAVFVAWLVISVTVAWALGLIQPSNES